MRAGFPKESGPVGVMLHEHDLGRIEIKGLETALARHAAGEQGADNDVLEHAENFIALLREHIIKEDNILFRLADQRLSAQEQAKLSEGFAAAEQGGVACVKKSEFIALLDRMERESQFETMESSPVVRASENP